MTRDDVKSSSKIRQCMLDDAPLFAGLEDGSWLVASSSVEKTALNDHMGVEHKRKVKSQQKKVPTVNEQTENTREIQTRPAALFLSIADLCALLSISRATLVRMDKNSIIPGRIKLGGSVRYHRETIEEWLADLVKKK